MSSSRLSAPSPLVTLLVSGTRCRATGACAQALRRLSRAAALAASLALAACAQGSVSGPSPAEQAAGETPTPTAPTATAPAPVLAAPVTPAEPQPVKVGLLLPLSGAQAELGEALLKAAQMAVFDLGDERFTLVVADTEGPGGVPAAAQSVVQAQSRIVLGPIFAAAVSQAAPAVRAAGIPMVTFSTDVSVAGNGVYVMGVLPSLQVERVVGYAASQGLRRVAVLAPSTPFGQTVVSSLQAAAPRFGAAVAQVSFYDTAATDMSETVRRLNPGGTPQFDALLIPEGAPRLRTIAPLVPYFDIDTTQVKLLGTALWDDPSLVAEPALIGGWFAAPQPEQWRSFAARYRSLYGSEPPRIASLAYDATALAAVLGRSEGGAGFGLEALTSPSGFSGIDGVFRFRPDGRVERGLSVFEIQPTGPAVIDPAPTSFEPTVF